MSSTELALRPTHDVDEMARIAKMLVISGYFETDRDQAKAIAQMATKILAGAELGFGAWASVTGIHVIQGKPVLGANLMAAAVKASARYDYRVKESSDKGVSIEFFERVDGKLSSLGVSSFSAKDAADAGLAANPNWKKFFRNMAFARAMSNGVRWFTPDVFHGAVVYSGDELGPVVDGDTGEILDAPGAPSGTAHAEVEYMQPEPEPRRQVTPATEAMLKTLNIHGRDYYGDEWDDQRHTLAEAVSAGATRSSKQLSGPEVQRLIDGIKKKLQTRDATPAQPVEAAAA